MSIGYGDQCCSTAGGHPVAAFTRPGSGIFLRHPAGVNGRSTTVFQVNPNMKVSPRPVEDRAPALDS